MLLPKPHVQGAREGERTLSATPALGKGTTRQAGTQGAPPTSAVSLRCSVRPAAAGGDRPRPLGARREVAAHARSRARCTLGRLSSRRPHSAGSAQGPRSLSRRLAREAHPGSARWRQGRCHGVERAGPALPHPGGVQKREPGRLGSPGQPSDLGRRGSAQPCGPFKRGRGAACRLATLRALPPPRARVDGPIARVAQGRRENANPPVGR